MKVVMVFEFFQFGDRTRMDNACSRSDNNDHASGDIVP